MISQNSLQLKMKSFIVKIDVVMHRVIFRIPRIIVVMIMRVMMV